MDISEMRSQAMTTTRTLEELETDSFAKTVKGRNIGVFIDILLLIGGVAWILFTLSRVELSQKKLAATEKQVHALVLDEKALQLRIEEKKEALKSQQDRLDEINRLVSEVHSDFSDQTKQTNSNKTQDTLTRIGHLSESVTENDASESESDKPISPARQRKIRELVAKGKASYAADSIKEALEYYRRAKDLSLQIGANPEPFYLLATHWYLEGDWETAKIRYKNALEIQSNYGPALYGYAKLKMLEGDLEEAARLAIEANKKMNTKRTQLLSERVTELLVLASACSSGNLSKCGELAEMYYFSNGALNTALHFANIGCPKVREAPNDKKSCHYLSKISTLQRDADNIQKQPSKDSPNSTDE
jgi:tetratricopeptide (TPR) repeat protein